MVLHVEEYQYSILSLQVTADECQTQMCYMKGGVIYRKTIRSIIQNMVFITFFLIKEI